VCVRAALQFSPDGCSPCPAGSRACRAVPEIRHPPAGRCSRYHGESGVSSAARAARGPDAINGPCWPAPAEDDGAWDQAQRALGDRVPDHAPAARAARVQVSARARLSHAAHPAYLVVPQDASDHHADRREQAARRVAARSDAGGLDAMRDPGPPALGAPVSGAPASGARQAPDGRRSSRPLACDWLAGGSLACEKSRSRRVQAPFQAASPGTPSRRTTTSPALPEHRSEPERLGFAWHCSPGHFQIQ